MKILMLCNPQGNQKALSHKINNLVSLDGLIIIQKIQSGNIVHRLKTGTQVTYADENEGWYQIEFANGKKGWVIKKYTKLLE